MNNKELAAKLRLYCKTGGITPEANAILNDAITRITDIDNRPFFKEGVTLNVHGRKLIVISEQTVNLFWEKVRDREKSMGKPTLYVDNLIYKFFLQKTSPAFIGFKSTTQILLEEIRPKQIFEEAKKLQINKVYTLNEGMSILETAIFDGLVDKSGNSVHVFCEGDEDNSYDLHMYRHTEGIHKDRLTIHMHGVSISLGAGSIICF